MTEASPFFPSSATGKYDFIAMLEQMREQERQHAYAEAASGQGPQPWEREWPLDSFDLEEHLCSLIHEIDGTLVGHLLTMVNWALSSPQGRRALVADGCSTNPGQHTLDTLRILRLGLVGHWRELLALQLDAEAMAQDYPVGDFNLFEHVTTCKNFRPNWFTTGELIEITEWALASDNAKRLRDELSVDDQPQQPIFTVIERFSEALAVHRRRLLLKQAKESLGYSKDRLEDLERCLER